MCFKNSNLYFYNTSQIKKKKFQKDWPVVPLHSKHNIECDNIEKQLQK